MTAFTLRLHDDIADRLNNICKEKGYSKTGVIKNLIKNFLDQHNDGARPPKGSKKKQGQGLSKLVGIVKLDDKYLSERVDDYLS